MEDFGALSLGSLSHAFLPVAIKGPLDGRFERSQPCEIDINCQEGAHGSWKSDRWSGYILPRNTVLV